MTSNEIPSELKALSSEKYKANVVKLGIPETCSIGVSTADVRKLAKKRAGTIPWPMNCGTRDTMRQDSLRYWSWIKRSLQLQEAETLMYDVISWDLCDHLCKNLLIKMKGYEELIEKWCDSEATYTKRAAFTLMASAAIHEKSLENQYSGSLPCAYPDELR